MDLFPRGVPRLMAVGPLVLGVVATKSITESLCGDIGRVSPPKIFARSNDRRLTTFPGFSSGASRGHLVRLSRYLAHRAFRCVGAGDEVRRGEGD